jgi:ubiquinone/menaquinone biosynthesis C-methylase UbiE
MSEEKQLVGKQYQDLYKGYYSNADRTIAKREISAVQSVNCIIDAIGGRTPGKLLDVGAGDGNVLVQLDARGVSAELYAVEISASGVDAIRSKSLSRLRDVRLFDGYKIPYPDKHFDLAIAVHVLEHVEHERLFLREIRRVSRYAHIEVPLEHGLRIQRSIDNGKMYGHINFYTKETLRSLLSSSGMSVMECKIVPPSLGYEQYLSGWVKGWLKNLVRKSALTIAPAVAPWLMVYNAYAYCECD